MRHVQLLLLFLFACLMAACSSASTDDTSSQSEQTSTTATKASTPATTSSTEAPAQAELVDSTSTTVIESDSVESETTTTQTSTPAPCGLAVVVAFDEGAPRDRVSISNESTADLSLTSVGIDLSDSAGSIIFDTLDGGSGVEVFQDFQVEAGDAVLANAPVAEDGATDLRLEFESFAAAESFTFSIDVDDQLTDSDLGQIQVTGAEIAGAIVMVTTGDGGEASAAFDQENTAQVLADC